MSFSFDARVHTLTEVVDDAWELSLKRQHLNNVALIRRELATTFGSEEGDRKEADFVALGPEQVSVYAVHNALLREIRAAFTLGAYFPALTASTALGERILNEVLFALRDKYFADHPDTRTISSKEAVQSWPKAVRILSGWDVIDAETVSLFSKLSVTRNQVLHWNIRDLHETGARTHALEAIQVVQAIVARMFPVLSGPMYFNVPGLAFLKKEAEEWPLVREFFLPASVLVSPRHDFVDFMGPNMHVIDNVEWSEDHGIQVLTDEGFAARIGT